MKKISLFIQIVLLLLCGCSGDDENPPSSPMKLFVNGEQIKIKQAEAVYTTWDFDNYNVAQLGFAGVISTQETFHILLWEYGVYDEAEDLQGGGFRPRVYITPIGEVSNDLGDCIPSGAGYFCDSFSLGLGPNGLNMGAHSENLSARLEIKSFNAEKKKVTGTFSVTGNKIGSGEPFSITGEFNLTYVVQEPV